MDAPPTPVEPEPDHLVIFEIADLVAELAQAIKDLGGQVR